MEKINMLKDKIQDLQNKKSNLQELIKKINNDITVINEHVIDTCVEKCGGHNFESYRESGLYGETFYVCKICGVEEY